MRKTLLGTVAIVSLLLTGLAFAQNIEVFSMGEPVTVGELVYRVNKAWWEKTPDGSDQYLGVAVTVTNKGSERVQLPPFQLIDANGRPHEVNFSKIVWPKMALNAGETLSGKLYFHLPEGEGFRMVVSGGYDEGEFAYVEINEVN